MVLVISPEKETKEVSEDGKQRGDDDDCRPKTEKEFKWHQLVVLVG